MFVDLVREEFEKRGVTLNEQVPFNPKEVDSNFSYHGEAMTDAGHVKISLYDWLHTCFALPDVAGKQVVCNPYSGKFNFYPEREAFGNEQYTREFVAMIFTHLDRVNIRPWEVTYKNISAEELANRPLADWIKDQKMGNIFLVDGFNKAEFVEQLLDDSCRNDDEESRAFTRKILMNRTDIEVLKVKRDSEESKMRLAALQAQQISSDEYESTTEPAPGL